MHHQFEERNKATKTQENHHTENNKTHTKTHTKTKQSKPKTKTTTEVWCDRFQLMGEKDKFRQAVTLNLLMTHAACLMAHVQIGLKVEISIPSFSPRACMKDPASGLTLPVAISTRLLPCEYAGGVVERVGNPIASRVFTAMRINCLIAGSLSAMKARSVCPRSWLKVISSLTIKSTWFLCLIEVQWMYPVWEHTMTKHTEDFTSWGCLPSGMLFAE